MCEHDIIDYLVNRIVALEMELAELRERYALIMEDLIILDAESCCGGLLET